MPVYARVIHGTTKKKLQMEETNKNREVCSDAGNVICGSNCVTRSDKSMTFWRYRIEVTRHTAEIEYVSRRGAHSFCPRYRCAMSDQTCVRLAQRLSISHSRIISSPFGGDEWTSKFNCLKKKKQKKCANDLFTMFCRHATKFARTSLHLKCWAIENDHATKATSAYGAAQRYVSAYDRPIRRNQPTDRPNEDHNLCAKSTHIGPSYGPIVHVHTSYTD